MPPDPGNFENDPLDLFSVAQSYWWEDLVFVASQRTSSADWLSPGLGTIIIALAWVLLVVLIQCGTVL